MSRVCGDVLCDLSDLVPEILKVTRMTNYDRALSVPAHGERNGRRNGISRCRPTMNMKNNSKKGK